MSLLSTKKEEVLLVVAFAKDGLLHVCRDKDGVERRMDLHVDGADIPTGEALVGQSVRIQGSQAYVELARGVTLVEQKELGDLVTERDELKARVKELEGVMKHVGEKLGLYINDLWCEPENPCWEYCLEAARECGKEAWGILRDYAAKEME